MRNRLCLVVDDDPSIRTYIKALLRYSGDFETLEADSGNLALRIMAALGNTVGLIVSDIEMPGGDGLTFAHSVRESFPDVPVILVSGHAPPPGACDFEFVEKPFTPDGLLGAVRRAIAPPAKAAERTTRNVPTIPFRK